MRRPVATSARPERAHGPELRADDAFDQALLAQVRPAGWLNPAPRGRYHLVVVGGGTGGLVSAAIAAGLGASVALVERGLLGGDCLNVGCVPSKALLRAARAWHDARTAAAEFGGPAAEGAGDFSAVMTRMRRLRAELSPVDSAERFRGLGVDVFLGEGRFVAPDAMDVGGARLRFRRAIIATGGRPVVPPVPGLADVDYLTNETVFNLTVLPPRLAIVGAGPIGCELAQAFARFGSKVTLLDSADRILTADDPDAAAVVRRSLEHDGIRIRVRTELTRVEQGPGGALLHLEAGPGHADAAVIETDRIVVAAGRRPEFDALALDRAGVRAGPRGIEVDDRMRTANRRIFAIGDVASRHRFTHAADAQARLAVPNALFFGLGGGRRSSLVLPWCTYTDPELAHTGRTIAELEADGVAYDTVTVPLAEVDRARLDGDTAGFVRVHVSRGRDRILGATLVSRHAGETISELTLAIRARLALSAIGATVHPYPTVAEALRKAADVRSRGRLTPSARRVLRGFFSLFR
jgi:pyruvate/2-oxoglutarate dehydrogenase complex dihydrolipoamide dehydrogenase (E3) component